VITELFALCDAATDYQGKLNILGAFDTVWARQMPTVHPLCAVAVRLRFARTEEGAHKVRINIVNDDGKGIIKPIEASINMQFKDGAPSTLATNIILNLQGLKFENFGEHAIDLAIDGRHEASLPLYINEFPEIPDN
jgi:hypothetical protein